MFKGSFGVISQFELTLGFNCDNVIILSEPSADFLTLLHATYTPYPVSLLVLSPSLSLLQ